MRKRFRTAPFLVLCALAWIWASGAALTGPNAVDDPPLDARAAIIPVEGTIDQAMSYSIRRRTELALRDRADYLIYEISTYGGLLGAADEIAKYLILEVANRGHTVAFVTTEAISAGALVAVSCMDVVMREGTTIGDAAPIAMGAPLEGVEREKAESFVRAAFQRAAEANDYPEALLRAMVTMRIEVYRVRNLVTGEDEFLEELPTDAERYDIEGAERVVSDEELLTLTASRALEYGVARAVVRDRSEALAFLEQRDGVRFVEEPMVLLPIWSEVLVSWLTSPAVMGILVMLALLGVYIEFSTPGFGLPGIVAVVCFALILGSRYLVGMANWVDIAMLFVGVALLLVEFLLLPGFGIAGFLGIILLLGGLFGMLVRNPPGELPWPETTADWQSLSADVIALGLGFLGFLFLAWLISRYLPRMKFASGLILVPAVPPPDDGSYISMTTAPESSGLVLRVGDVGEVVSRLRPAGKARFGDALVDVVAVGEFLNVGTKIEITGIYGSRVVVKRREQGGEA